MSFPTDIEFVEVEVPGVQGPPGTGAGLPTGGVEGDFVRKRGPEIGDVEYGRIREEDLPDTIARSVSTTGAVEGDGSSERPVKLTVEFQQEVADATAAIAATQDALAASNESVAAQIALVNDALSRSGGGITGGIC